MEKIWCGHSDCIDHFSFFGPVVGTQCEHFQSVIYCTTYFVIFFRGVNLKRGGRILWSGFSCKFVLEFSIKCWHIFSTNNWRTLVKTTGTLSVKNIYSNWNLSQRLYQRLNCELKQLVPVYSFCNFWELLSALKIYGFSTSLRIQLISTLSYSSYLWRGLPPAWDCHHCDHFQKPFHISRLSTTNNYGIAFFGFGMPIWWRKKYNAHCSILGKRF